MLIVALILGIALGACAACVYGSRRLNAAERELAATRAELDVERLPVTDDGRLLGVVAREPIARRLAEDEPPPPLEES